MSPYFFSFFSSFSFLPSYAAVFVPRGVYCINSHNASTIPARYSSRTKYRRNLARLRSRLCSLLTSPL